MMNGRFNTIEWNHGAFPQYHDNLERMDYCVFAILKYL